MSSKIEEFNQNQCTKKFQHKLRLWWLGHNQQVQVNFENIKYMWMPFHNYWLDFISSKIMSQSQLQYDCNAWNFLEKEE